MSLLRSFSFDLAFYGASKGFVAIAWVATLASLTKNLAPHDYAVFWQLFTLITGSATVATTGVVTALRRYRGQFEQDNLTTLYDHAALDTSRRTLLISSALFIPVVLICDRLGAWDASPAVLALSLMTFMAAVAFLLYCGRLMAVRQTKIYLWANTGQALTFMILSMMVLQLVHGDDVALALLLLLASYLITASAYRRRPDTLPPSLLLERQRWQREFFRFGLPLAFMNAAMLLATLGTQIIITNAAGAAEAGYYAAYAAPVERLVGFASSIAAMAFLPIIARHWDNRRYREVMRFLIVVIGIVGVISALVAIGLILFDQVFLGLIIDERYSAGAQLLPILGAATVVSAITAILADILVLQKRTLQLAWIFLAASVLGMVISIVLATTDGAHGAAIGRLVGAIVSAVGIVIAIGRNFRVDVAK